MREHTTHFTDCGCFTEMYKKRISDLETEVKTLSQTLRIAAADYWREQMDALATDHPVDHIIDATIAKWIARAKESKG